MSCEKLTWDSVCTAPALYIKTNSELEPCSLFGQNQTYHFLFKYWIEKPIATITKMTMMRNRPITTVRIIPSKLLLIVVGTTVGEAVTVL